MNYKDLISAVRLIGHGMVAILIVMLLVSVIVYLFVGFLTKEKKN